MKTKSRQASLALKDFLQGSSILTSSQKQDLTKRMTNECQDFHVWHVDWQLLDAFKVVFPDMVQVLVSAAKDRNITKKFYCRSKTIEQADGFVGNHVSDHSWNENVRVAVRVLSSQVVKHLEPKVLTPLSDVRDFWTNEDASAGAIGRGTKAENASDCLVAALKIKEHIKRGTDYSKVWIPAIGFHRAQISNFVTDDFKLTPESIKFKDRLVWGLDGGSVTVEAQYALPLIQHLSRNWTGYAGGKSPEELRLLISNRCMSQWTSIDYSKFDQTIPSWLISLAFRIIKKMFDEKYHPELDWIEYNFIHTHLVMNGGFVMQKHCGIPSGSNFTQAVGSMVNAIMLYTYISSCFEGSFEDKCDYVKHAIKMMLCMGDDNLFYTVMNIRLDDMAAYVKAVFGVTINEDKCGQGSSKTYPEFLKREWRPQGEYMNPAYLTINTTHPERDRSYDGYSPWHIIYGLYVTYKASFPIRIDGVPTEVFIVKKMQAEYGVRALVEMDVKDLPGVFRAYGRKALISLADRADRVVRVAWP